MDRDALAGALTPRRPDPPPWSENGAWLLWGLLSCGFLTGVGLLIVGLRYQRRDWVRWAAIYGAVSVVLFATLVSVPRDANGNNVSGSGWQDVVGPILSLVMLGGVIHSAVIQGRQPRRVALPPQPGWPPGWVPPPGAPRPMVRVTYGRPPLWPLPPGAYVPPWPYPAPATRAAGAVPVEPWAGFVRSAEGARDRFRHCAAQVHPGPLHEALDDLAGRIDAGVDECRRIATAGRVLAEARAGIDTRLIDRAFAEAEARRAADPDDPLAASTMAALQSQNAAAKRLDVAIDDALDRLRLLDARLGEAVARMLELSAQAEAAVSVPELSNDVDGLVTDLEALRLAVEETHALDVLGRPTTTAPAPAEAPGMWDQPE